MAGLDVIAYVVGGWAALTVALAVFIGKFFSQTISDNLKMKWSREQEEKLEHLRAEITREHSIFTTILNSYSYSHQFSQSNRIEAVQTLWDNILMLRHLSSFPALFFDTLLEREYNVVYDNEIIMGGLNALSVDDTFTEISKIMDTVEKYRPFIGEQLWSLFHVYLILSARVVFLLAEGRDDKSIISWDKDKYLQLILNNAFNDEDRKTISSTPQNMNPLRPTTELMERKILFEMFKITSGELAAESDYSKAKKLQDLIKQVNISHNITK